MNTTTSNIVTVIDSIPADLRAEVAYLMDGGAYKLQKEAYKEYATTTEAVDTALEIVKAMLTEMTSYTKEEDIQEAVWYLAACTGTATSVTYTDGEDAVIVLTETNPVNIARLTDSFLNDEYLLIENNNGVLKTVAGIYNNNDLTIKVAVPHHMVVIQNAISVASETYINDWLETQPELKAKVDAFKASL